MSEPMKKPHTKRRSRSKTQNRKYFEEKASIPWREVFKKEIEKFGESGCTLRGARYKKDITQLELAKALGISQHHISEMENGKRPIGKDMAKRLAEFFETDYRVFL